MLLGKASMTWPDGTTFYPPKQSPLIEPTGSTNKKTHGTLHLFILVAPKEIENVKSLSTCIGLRFYLFRDRYRLY